MIRPFLCLLPDRSSHVEEQLAAVIGGRVQGDDVDVQASKAAIHRELPRASRRPSGLGQRAALSLRPPTP
jgi:hypothetical protein